MSGTSTTPSLSPSGPTAAAGDAPARSPRRHLWILALLLALLLGEVAATLIQRAAAPRERDWQAATSALRAARRSGEPVLFAPAWIEPLGRLHLAKDLALEELLLSDVDRFPRVFEVSTRGAHHPWLAPGPDIREDRILHDGPVTVRLIEKQAAAVLFNFTSSIERATVARVGQRAIPCPWEGNRFRCDPRQGWNWVGRHLAEVGHRPYRAIYAHAIDGYRLQITFPDVPLGGTLVGYTGIDDFENRKRSSKAVTLTVKVGERQVGVIRHENDWPWRRFTLDTAPLAASGPATVHFEITTEGAFARTFCFHAEARR